jgi:glyoxylase I family protein
LQKSAQTSPPSEHAQTRDDRQPAAALDLKISGVHHVAIICSDYEKSRYFYSNILGLAIVSESYRPERASHKLDLALPDGTQIELFSFPDPPQRPSYPETCGLRHLAFAVRDLEQAVARLSAHGIVVEEVRVDELTGKRYTFFADPDGLPLELYEEQRA